MLYISSIKPTMVPIQHHLFYHAEHEWKYAYNDKGQLIQYMLGPHVFYVHYINQKFTITPWYHVQVKKHQSHTNVLYLTVPRKQNHEVILATLIDFLDGLVYSTRLFYVSIIPKDFGIDASSIIIKELLLYKSITVLVTTQARKSNFMVFVSNLHTKHYGSYVFQETYKNPYYVGILSLLMFLNILSEGDLPNIKVSSEDNDTQWRIMNTKTNELIVIMLPNDESPKWIREVRIIAVLQNIEYTSPVSVETYGNYGSGYLIVRVPNGCWVYSYSSQQKWFIPQPWDSQIPTSYSPYTIFNNALYLQHYGSYLKNNNHFLIARNINNHTSIQEYPTKLMRFDTIKAYILRQNIFGELEGKDKTLVVYRTSRDSKKIHFELEINQIGYSLFLDINEYPQLQAIDERYNEPISRWRLYVSADSIQQQNLDNSILTDGNLIYRLKKKHDNTYSMEWIQTHIKFEWNDLIAWVSNSYICLCAWRLSDTRHIEIYWLPPSSNAMHLVKSIGPIKIPYQIIDRIYRYVTEDFIIHFYSTTDVISLGFIICKDMPMVLFYHHESWEAIPNVKRDIMKTIKPGANLFRYPNLVPLYGKYSSYIVLNRTDECAHKIPKILMIDEFYAYLFDLSSGNIAWKISSVFCMNKYRRIYRDPMENAKDTGKGIYHIVYNQPIIKNKQEAALIFSRSPNS